jgi:hypothetical protein
MHSLQRRRIIKALALAITIFAALHLHHSDLLAAIPLQERNALIDLYNSTGGPNWYDNSGWLGAVGTECSWYGITCNSDQTSVESIVLSSNWLSGSIPATLGNLANLQSLDLSSYENYDEFYNYLTGSIPPELGNLANLQWLGLSWNYLTGSIPPELGNLTNLLGLYLDRNQLSGSIPSSLGNLANLLELYLGNNQLSGSIPSELGNLANLFGLGLGSNQLSGSIPSSFANLINLSHLDLSSNQLSGSIPPDLGSLVQLQHLNLSNNQLSGSVPTEFGNLATLLTLRLNVNQLSGSIPPELGNLNNLFGLFLDSNMLRGNIPSSLVSLIERGTFSFSFNALSTNDPDLNLLLMVADPYCWTKQTFPPLGLSAVAQSSSSIRVSWSPAYSEYSGRYQVYQSTTPDGPYTLAGSTPDKLSRSFIVDGLSENTPYYFVVQTVTDPHTNNQNTVTSEYSAQISATIPSDFCTIGTNPAQLAFTVDGQGYAEAQMFSWAPGSTHTVGTSSPQPYAWGSRFVFQNWSDGGAISHTVTVPASWAAYTANFATQYLLTSSVYPNGGGNITANPNSTDAFYDSGTSVTLTATPNTGFVFANWDVCAPAYNCVTSSTNPLVLPMAQSTTATARFVNVVPATAITIETNPHGAAFTVDGQNYTRSQTFVWVIGSTHTIGASSPQSGASGIRFVFQNWSDGGAINHTITVYGISGVFYTANFATQYLLTGNVSPAGGGSITANPNAPDGYYNSGTSVTLTATSNAGFVFANWNQCDFAGNCVSSSTIPLVLTMTQPVSTTANFLAASTYKIETNPPGLAFGVDGQNYTQSQTFSWNAGDTHTIGTSSPQTGASGSRYAFQNWSDGGAISHIITVPANPATYTANFAPQYLLTRSVSPAGGGSITANPNAPDEYYNSGTSVTLTATPNTGFVFVNWNQCDSAGNCVPSTTNPLVLTMTQNVSVSANFLAIVSDPPSLTSIGPKGGMIGSSVNVNLAGTNFVSGARVNASSPGVTVSNVYVVSSTQIAATFRIAADATPGTVGVAVTTSNGTSGSVNFSTYSDIAYLTGLSATASPTEPTSIGVELYSPVTSQLDGTLALTFQHNAANAPPDYRDPHTQFAAGGTTLDFTIPAGETVAALAQNGLIQQGTVAGDIKVTLTRLNAGGVSLLSETPPSKSVTVPSMAPVITPGSLAITGLSSSGFNVEFKGYSTSREILWATYTFLSSSGTRLDGTTTFPVSLGTVAPAYFSGTTGLQSGGYFKLNMPFAYTGDTRALGSVTVTLSNSKGYSLSQTVEF